MWVKSKVIQCDRIEMGLDMSFVMNAMHQIQNLHALKEDLDSLPTK